MPYRFHRLPAAGWELFIAYPETVDSHRVRFPTPGITPANRYQLLMFLEEPTDIVLEMPDNTAVEVQMAPGTTSLDFPMDAFPQGSVWSETPAVQGHIRMCIAPAGALRRWLREVVHAEAGQTIALAPTSVAVILTGPDSAKYVHGADFTVQHECKVLIASFP